MPFRFLFFLMLFGAAGLGCGPASSAQPLGTERDTAPRYDLAAFERLVLSEVNRVREAAGARPITPDDRLAAIARAHSQDMLDRGFVAHRTPDGRAPGERALRAGYAFREFGENIFSGALYDTVTRTQRGDQERALYLWYAPEELAQLVAEMWMESPSHRENMLAPRYDYGGIGVVIGPDFEVLITLNLSAR